MYLNIKSIKINVKYTFTYMCVYTVIIIRSNIQHFSDYRNE